MNHLHCFYTPGQYEVLARTCVESFGKMETLVHPYLMTKSATWMEDCKKRAILLHKNIAAYYPEDGVGLLDADLECLRDPLDLKRHDWKDTDGQQCDVAVHDLIDAGVAHDDRSRRYSAGVIVFAPTPLGRKALSAWAELCSTDPLPDAYLREQIYLYKAIHETGARVFNLGKNYNQTIDDYVVGDETVILHAVASRELKEVSGG